MIFAAGAEGDRARVFCPAPAPAGRRPLAAARRRVGLQLAAAAPLGARPVLARGHVGAGGVGPRHVAQLAGAGPRRADDGHLS